MDHQFLLDFFDQYIDLEKPVGLAYSGGCDSEALYQYLLEIKKRYSFSFHIIHVNHNWREKSTLEANYLEQKVKKDGWFFHRKDLTPFSSSSNMEEKARKARLQFFREVTETFSLQGIFLAHHKDDLAETVLKKVLEGSHLVNIASLKHAQKIDALTLFRPLLSITKKQLKKYLTKKNQSYLEDTTNLDPKFLRTRLRMQILPELTHAFGKEVVNNLILLSERSEEMRSYFEQKLPYPKKISGPFGNAYDFNQLNMSHILEWKTLLISILSAERIVLSREIIQKIATSLRENMANKRFIQNKREVICDRSVLFVMNKKINFSSSAIDFEDEITCFGPLQIILRAFPEAELNKEMKGWKNFWKGLLFLYLPNGKCKLASYDRLNEGDRKKIRKRWSNQKIPVFLRKFPLIISDDGQLIDDLLSYKEMSGKRLVELKVNFLSGC